MDRRRFITSLIACPLCASAASAEGTGPHWEYEGAHGPPKWGEIDSKFKACAVGAEQSPINLTNAVPASVDKLSIHWKSEAFQLVNNGHTIQANARNGGTLKIGKTNYTLQQFHFHTPSEHAFDGKRTAMEAHFVHAAPDGRLAVVGVLMVAGKTHKGFAHIMREAPKKAGEATLKAALSPRDFLPKARAFYRYQGSLTTPPCSEVVDWNVLGATIEVAEADIAAFKALYPMNARPLQAPNRRFLLKGV